MQKILRKGGSFLENSKKTLLISLITMVLCLGMLIGATWAWFSDQTTSGVNTIVAGNLDVELYHAVGTVKADAANRIDSGTGALFRVPHWEPGVVAYENFMVKNVGNLALKFVFELNIGEFNKTVDGGHSLKEVLKAAIVPGGFDGDRSAAHSLSGYTPLDNLSNRCSELKPGESQTFGVVIYWEPTEQDNDFNLYDGHLATTTEKFTDPKVLAIELGAKLVATQLANESDSFGIDYDADVPLAASAQADGPETLASLKPAAETFGPAASIVIEPTEK